MKSCAHLDQIRDVTPRAEGCEECLKMGDTWVRLRLRLECGHVRLLRFVEEQARDQTLPSH